ncbi:MAG: DNA polymerase I [Patescibacteria group bacterium]
MPSLKTFLILDGNALLHRAWHSLPQTMTTPDGVVINAAYGFTLVIEKMLSDLKPDFIAVAWDLAGKTFRHDEFEAYKATRVKKEQELYDQIPIIQAILTCYGIPSLSKKGFEADDILGTIAQTNKKHHVKTLIVTGDQDALQLVDDDTSVLFFVKGVSQTKTFDSVAVREKYGFDPLQLIDYKALMGDASDNLKGVVGIGEKSAKELIAQFGSVENILEAVRKTPDKIKPTWRAKFEGQEKHTLQMKRLVTIVRDVPLGDFQLEDAEVKPKDEVCLFKKFRELGFRSLIKKYETVAQGDLFKVGGDAVPAPQVIDGVTVGYNLKAEMHRRGKVITGALFDLKIAAYLLNSTARGYDLPSIAQQWLDKTELAESDLLNLYKKLSAELKKEDLFQVMNEIDMPVLPIIYEMERDGIKLDVDFLAGLSKTMNADLDKLTKKIHQAAGSEFNINSPSQMADVLFETLEIPTHGIKRTKTGYSTAIDELEKIEDQHEIVPLIMEYRELAKLVSTYVDALPSLVQKDGRIHTTWDQTGTATGRISSNNPNLQNIPIRTEQGREIRKAFIAEKGHLLVAADYSQFELRLAAVIAKDASFLRAFKEGADIHKRTAAEIFEIDEDKVTHAQRRAAKTVNFAVLYGMGPRNLAKSTGMSQTEAKQFIDKYFEIHHAVREYIDGLKIKVHADGWVETMFGRKRYFPEINTGVGMLVAQAERMAVNMPIQGTEADIMKMAMREIDVWIKKDGVDAKQLLQVHDEIVVEVKKEDAERVGKQMKKIMEGVATFDVPLVVDIKIGKSWGEMEEIE